VDGVRRTDAHSEARSETGANVEPVDVVSSPLARTWFGRPQRRTSDAGRWPFRVGICAICAVTLASVSIVMRAEHTTVGWTVIALTAVAVLPWVVDLLVVEVPPWLFAPAVIVPVAVLHDPSRFDPLPLILAILALDMALWLGVVKSAPIVLAGAVAIAWPIPAATDDPGWLGRPLAALVVMWLVGVVLHSQTRRMAILRRRAEALGGDVVHLHVPSIRQALASIRDADDPEELRRWLQEVDDLLDQLARRFAAPTCADRPTTTAPSPE
jgi:hypothetical protein